MTIKKTISAFAILISLPVLAVECPKELTLKLKQAKKTELFESQANFSRLIKNEIELMKALKVMSPDHLNVVRELRASTDRRNTLEADLALSKKELKDWEQCSVVSEANLKAQAIAELKEARGTYLNQVCNDPHDSGSATVNIFYPFSVNLQKIQERYSHLNNIESLIQEYNPMSIVVKETRPTTSSGGLDNFWLYGSEKSGVEIIIPKNKIMLEKGIYPVTFTKSTDVNRFIFTFSNPAVSMVGYNWNWNMIFTLARLKEILAKTGNVQLELASPEQCLSVQIPTVEKSVAPSISTSTDHPSISDSTEVKDLPKKGTKPSSSPTSGAIKQ